MKLSQAALTAVSGWILLTVMAPQATLAEDACAHGGPDSATDVRGYTWIATVSAITPRDGGGNLISFATEHVYADAHAPSFPADQVLAAGESYVMPSVCTGPVGLRVGRRYLLSSSALAADGTSTNLFVAWRLDGAKAVFVDMYDVPIWAPLTKADTLDGALALVAPGATLPPSDASSTSGPQDDRLGLTFVFIGLFIAAWFGARRLTRDSGGKSALANGG